MTILTKNNRTLEIDVLRGSAIVLMVIFHFGYDLTVFGWASYNTSEDLEWQIFRAVIVSAFLLAVGMSSYLAYHHHINKTKLIKAVSKLVMVSALLTIFSLFMYPNAWIYFGIIHFIAVALPISVLFVRVPKIALIVGVLSITGYWLGYLELKAMWEWSVIHLGIPNRTVDVVSFFPWIGLVLIGIYLMSLNLMNISVTENRFTKSLSYLGQHSLVLYLIHQPILYLLLGIVSWIISGV
jgi:uncharacterized membrane protein